MQEHYPFTLPVLEYGFDALEPYIDEETVNIHYGKHFKKYADNLNKVLAEYPKYQSWSIERLITQNRLMPYCIQKEVFNNAGGYYNHAFYFSMLTPAENSYLNPKSDLSHAIKKSFGSFNEMKDQLTEASTAVFGSGYGWLLYEPTGNLKIGKTSNQDTDLSIFGEKLLNIDVWEHAYYLKYTSNRKEYVENIFRIINWTKAEKAYSNFLESKCI